MRPGRAGSRARDADAPILLDPALFRAACAAFACLLGRPDGGGVNFTVVIFTTLSDINAK